MKQLLPIVACTLSAAGSLAQDFVPGVPLQTSRAFSPQLRDVIRADLDGNGSEDLLIGDLSGQGGVFTLLNPGAGSASATTTTIVLGSSVGPFGGLVELRGLADMNADGFDDAVFAVSSLFPFSPPLGVYTAAGDGQGGFAAPVRIITLPAITRVTLGDFDADGQADLAVKRAGSLSNEIYLQNSGQLTLALTLTGSGLMTAGDFNGDGIDDLAVVDDGQITLQPGGLPFATATTIVTNAANRQGIATDLDGDGADDLVLGGTVGSALDWMVFFGDTAAPLGAPAIDLLPGGIPGGGSGDIELADLDADGVEELLLRYNQNQETLVVRHDGARGFSPAALDSGIGGLLIDLDDDGDLDMLTRTTLTEYDRHENIAIFGDACVGGAGAPSLDVGIALPGNQSFAFTLRDASPNQLAVLFLSAAPMPGPCGLQLDINQLQPGLTMMTDATGAAAFAVPLPVGLPRGPYFLQSLAFDPAGTFPLPGASLVSTPGRTISVY
ncbi:MAG: FG-GAP repeat domain-containing protein [Planctomycetota bacterium]